MPVSSTRDLIAEAERRARHLSPHVRARLALARLRRGDREVNVESVLLALDRAAEADASDFRLPLLMAALATAQGSVHADGTARALSYAERAVAAAPREASARYQLAEALSASGLEQRALAEYELAARDERYRADAELSLRIGVLHYNRAQFAQAREAYQRAAAVRSTSAAHLYLGDSLRALGDYESARTNYRQALLLEPTLVDALRGYWGVVEEGDLPEPGNRSFERLTRRLAEAESASLTVRRLRRRVLSRLLLWRFKRHPEDARLHYMLGYCALLQRDFVFAEERLTFAYQLWGPTDLESLGARGVARALQGRVDEARTDFLALRDAPDDLGSDLGPADAGRRAGVVVSPFYWEPTLVSLPHSEEVFALTRELFSGGEGEDGARL